MSTYQNNYSHTEMANAIRALSMDAVEKAKSGHPGMPMGMADVATILFSQFLKFNPQDASWAGRDRFVLSAGHGSMLLYSILYLTGYPDISLDDLKNFRQLHAKTAGHPEYGHLAGIEITTGPLGQGLASAVGMALAERIMASRFKELIDNYTYVIAGDGCLMEGISQEAISMAGHLGLGKLIILFDDNSITIDGPTSLSTSDDQLARFKASNWHVQTINGHDYEQIAAAITEAKASPLPSLIACKTTIAYGAPTKAGSESSHGSPLGEKEIQGTREKLNWPHAPFMIPEDILISWRQAGNKNALDYQHWQTKLASLPDHDQAEFNRLMSGDLPPAWEDKIQQFKADSIANKVCEASRKSSGRVLNALVESLPELIGGSADLTGSNDTKTPSLHMISKDNFTGRYIYYGIREHAMAAMMNGMVLYKGIIPYGGTFLVFSDYCRPAIRLAALMKQRVIYVMTHDSIGLGEDGPTHQPIEHLSSLRAIPNLLVLRPADSVETAECWQIAILSQDAPSLLALTRQNLPLLRYNQSSDNLCAKGAYILQEAIGALRVTIIATGSEVSIALEAQQLLQAQHIGTRVISMPCTALFDQQPADYKQHLLCNDSLKIAVEAANGYGWERYIGTKGIFIGMDGFGSSAKAEDLYSYFGITAENIVTQAIKRIKI